MSSKLDVDLRRQVIDIHRDERGRIICAGCHREVIGKGFQIDHILPEIDGGAVDNIDNLQVLCVRKDGLGCHARKTKREAAQRAARRRQLERSPLRRATPAALAASGALMTGWAVTDLLAVAPALDPDRVALAAATAVAALVAGDNVVKRRALRAPRKPAGSTAGGAPTPARTPEQRLTTVLREVLMKGERGDVTVTALVLDKDGVPESFTATYAGTEFPDRDERRRADVRDQLAVKYGVRWLLEWDQRHDRLHVRRRPPMPKKIDHPGLEPGRAWHQIPIAPDGRFDFLLTPHILIIGTTGSGKTSLLRAIIVAALASARDNDQVETWLVDPKEVELLGFKGWPGVTHLFSSTDDLWRFPLILLEEMRERYRLFREQKVPLSSHKVIICIIDEFRDLIDRLEAEWTGNPDRGRKTGMKNPAVQAISELLRKARLAGIHLVLSTQRPDASWFGGENRSNVTGRAGVGALDPDAARMIFGQTIGTDIPAGLKGRTSIQMDDMAVIEVQTYWVPNPSNADRNYNNTPEDWQILRRLGMPEALISEWAA